ncbi:MAG: efflux RND transporter periplasmic adaptor subunit [Pseudomonadota bacterium]
MRSIAKRRILEVLAAAVVIAGVAWFARPRGVPVDLATVARMPMEVTVDEEAKTRIRRIYTVSAPLTGTVLRIDREAGDAVVANQTVVAVMRPAAAGFHDPRLHQELRSAQAASSAAVALAEAERRRVEAALDLARVEFARIRALAAQNLVARSALDQARAAVQANEAALASAAAALEVRRNERASASARLRNPVEIVDGAADAGCCVRIRSPVTGRILTRLQESEAVVPAGAPLVQVGDPTDLEIVAELLSDDAVQVNAADRVRIDGWGGAPVEGRVRRVEPAGFVKVSALGIEEQRVRTIIDLIDPPQRWQRLGHDYRVIVRIVIWSRPDALTVPLGALFRNGERWAVFVDDGGRARLRMVRVGRRNSRVAEVLSGLAEGERVVLHPGDRVDEGARIAQRD